jgi:5-methylcytosine-specific restriction endonuclease McrA
MLANKYDNFFNLFDSRKVAFPITTSALSTLISQFVLFYPVYDSFIQIAKGADERLRWFVEKVDHWLKRDSPELAEPENKSTGREVKIDLATVRAMAEKRVKIMPAMRWQVFQRDRWKCVACGRGAADSVILHVDHIVPRSKGGSGSLDNFQTLCNACNLGKSNRDNTDLRRKDR